MSIYRKKYQNVFEKKNHLDLVTKDHNTIESLEGQALDSFFIGSSPKEYYMQRMGQLQIVSRPKRYFLKKYKNEQRITFPGEPRKIPIKNQTLDNFMIKQKEKPRNIVQKPVYFKIYSKPQKIVLREEQLDSFICPRIIKPPFELQNIQDFLIEREKRIENRIQSLNRLKLPAVGKFFNNHPKLKEGGMFEFEILKIKAPFKLTNTSNLFIPQKLKKLKYFDISSEKSSNLKYIINKIKKFSPNSTVENKGYNLLIPKQPKNTSFEELTPEKIQNISYDFMPKKRPFDMITIDNAQDIFIPEAGIKKYYSVKMDNINIIGNERPKFCLEIDPNEEIFCQRAYDMLLIQNYWDDLEMKSFRLCLRPNWWKSTRDLELKSSNNEESKNSFNDEDNKENQNEENTEFIKKYSQDIRGSKDFDVDILKEFKEKFVREKGKKHKTHKVKENDLYEDKEKNDFNNQKISILKDKGKSKDKKGKGVGFTDLAKKALINKK